MVQRSGCVCVRACVCMCVCVCVCVRVCLIPITRNNGPLHLQQVTRKVGLRKKEKFAVH